MCVRSNAPVSSPTSHRVTRVLSWTTYGSLCRPFFFKHFFFLLFQSNASFVFCRHNLFGQLLNKRVMSPSFYSFFFRSLSKGAYAIDSLLDLHDTSNFESIMKFPIYFLEMSWKYNRATRTSSHYVLRIYSLHVFLYSSYFYLSCFLHLFPLLQYNTFGFLLYFLITYFSNIIFTYTLSLFF